MWSIEVYCDSANVILQWIILLKHPDKVPSNWLQKVPTSSKQQVAPGKGYQHVTILTYVCNKYCIVTGLGYESQMKDIFVNTSVW